MLHLDRQIPDRQVRRYRGSRRGREWAPTPFLLSRKSLRFLGSAMGIAIANRKNQEIAAISGVRDGHRNRKSQKSLRFRRAKVLVLVATMAENEQSARDFCEKLFCTPPVMDVRVFGSWMSAPKSFFQAFEGLSEVFAPGHPHEWPRDVRRMSGPKTFSLGCFFVPEMVEGLVRHLGLFLCQTSPCCLQPPQSKSLSNRSAIQFSP